VQVMAGHNQKFYGGDMVQGAVFTGVCVCVCMSVCVCMHAR